MRTFEGRLIIIRKWITNVKFEKDVLKTIPIWMRIYDLPIHFRNAVVVSKVCSSFAQPIYMDNLTLHRDQGGFVRVIVEIDIKVELPDMLEVDFLSEDYQMLMFMPTLSRQGKVGNVSGVSTSNPFTVLNASGEVVNDIVAGDVVDTKEGDDNNAFGGGMVPSIGGIVDTATMVDKIEANEGRLNFP
ncbi:uncharacterized protein LOC132277469 [Cornus florida]|uniref:uncharacterized protein LOC132277469 n=1 Tax=Cornus florida TaxID=4283 RepID=UPI00289B9B55|nr:uncharacterized protein LOC132277469 [Cornus florida]